MNEGLDRGALFYPYIHIRDDRWLKATMLCFPYIQRMVPEGYSLTDGALASFFASKDGRLGRRMLGEESFEDGSIEGAQRTLLRKLREDLEHGESRLERFTRQSTAEDSRYKFPLDAFQLHENKVSRDLVRFLVDLGLAWRPDRPLNDRYSWWAFHPVLGEAISSTNAVALADRKDLEIVTATGSLHEALLATDVESVYDVLVRERPTPHLGRVDSLKVNDLMRFVIYNEFNVERLSAEDIQTMNLERADISALKAELAKLVADVGRVPDRDLWASHLEIRARDVIEAWNERRMGIPSLKRAAESLDVMDLGEDFVKDVIGGMFQAGALAIAAGTLGSALAGAVPGLLVGVAFFGGKLLVEGDSRRRKSPYRFLSKLHKAAGRRVTGHVLAGEAVSAAFGTS